ncbi:IS66 family insertion sequence element accessory protein TnpB [Lysinibacillus fusiformis]
MKHDFTNVKNIYIVCRKTDMRKGIDGLATLIQDSFELDPYSDSIFLFCGLSNHKGLPSCLGIAGFRMFLGLLK